MLKIEVTKPDKYKEILFSLENDHGGIGWGMTPAQLTDLIEFLSDISTYMYRDEYAHHVFRLG